MKLSHILFCAVLVLAYCGNALADNPFSGNWYATQYGCRTEVVFNDNNTVTISSESNSQANMTLPYQTQKVGNHYNFDFNMPGMESRGIALLPSKGRLKISVVFGPEQYAPRPVKYEDAAKSAGGMMLDLYRDVKMVKSVLDKKVAAPAAAQLAFERNKRLGKGLNLNGYVDGNPVDGNDAPMTEADFKAIAEAGFQSVRIPTKWVAHCAKQAPYTIDKDFFEKMDWTIAQCFKNGLAVSIDQHYYPYINMSEDDPDLTWGENLDRIKSLWAQIAEHYKDYPDSLLYFDLLNEPNLRIGADALNRLHADLIRIIRKTNLGRTIIIGTPNLGQTWTLGELTFPKDEWNIIVQGHYYLPHTFTHQNLEYVPSAMTGHQVEWNGTEQEKAPIIYDLDFCKRWSDIQQRPVNIGEYGVCQNANQQSRSRYLQFIQQEMRSRSLSSHIWAYRGLFGLCDLKTKQWNRQTLKALGTISGKCTVRFNLNTGSAADTLAPIVVDEGSVIPLAQKPRPMRDGYRFAGWYTSPTCTPTTEWLFGEKLKSMYPKEVADRQPVNDNMTLYARWVTPKHISTPEQLQAMKDDLYGWYVLDNDIDMRSVTDWQPVGTYMADYEWCDGEWWTAAFKGRFDGQGHAIRNLAFTNMAEDKMALFGAAANADIRDLDINNYKVDLVTKRNAPYIAPLIGIAKQDFDHAMTITNVHVKKANIKAVLANGEGMYASVTGLMAGIWKGDITGCSIDGKLTVTVEGAPKGVLFAGGLTGETFSHTSNCTSTLDVNARLGNSAVEANIGGLQATCESIAHSISRAHISVSGGTDDAKIFVGGIAGSMRYGELVDCHQQGIITLKDSPKMHVGGLLGEFSQMYGSIGSISGISQTTISHCTTNGRIKAKGVTQLVCGDFVGTGIPKAAANMYGGKGMTYSITDCEIKH